MSVSVTVSEWHEVPTYDVSVIVYNSTLLRLHVRAMEQWNIVPLWQGSIVILVQYYNATLWYGV